MGSNLGKVIAFITSTLLILAFNQAAWSQTHAKASQDRASGLAVPTPGSLLPALGENKIITEADCTAVKLGSTIPVSVIGEPVSRPANSPICHCRASSQSGS